MADAILTTVVYDDAYFLFSRRSHMPPIECDLGYRFRTLTLTLTLILKLTLTLTLILTLKVTIIYAVQNDTQIKFKIVL